MPLPEWFQQSVWGSMVTIGVAVILLMLGLRWQETLLGWIEAAFKKLPKGWQRAWLPRIRRLISTLDVVRQPRASFSAGLWTFLTWGFGILANWSVLTAFGESSIPAAMLLIVGLMLGSAVVPTPARLGVFEGISVVVLRFFNVSADRALAIGLVLHGVVLGPPVVTGAALSLWDVIGQAWRRKNRRSQ